MSIFMTARYEVQPDAVDQVTAAIVQFVDYIESAEPGSIMYRAWQNPAKPTEFVHLFEFADEAARELHGQSAAVKRFEAVYIPQLVSGPVKFTQFVEVASVAR